MTTTLSEKREADHTRRIGLSARCTRLLCRVLALKRENRTAERLRVQYGLYHGSRPPYGYVFGPDITVKTVAGQTLTGHSLVRGPAQAAVVEVICARFIDGLSPREIAAGLHRRGIGSPDGRRWKAAHVRAIVRRVPLYAGYVAHPEARQTGMLYPGQHAALLDWQTTLAVLAVTGRTLHWTFGPARTAQAQETEV